MLKTIKLLVVFLLVIIISLFSFLFSGIKIDSFSFGDVLISQFYIKMDKKLILDIENIEYKSKKSQVKSSFEDLKKNIELLPTVLKIFQRIHIERLKIDDNEFTIVLDNKNLYLDNKFVNISSKVDYISNQVVFDLYSLYLKDIELLIDGKIKLDYFKENINFYGGYLYKDLQGKANVELDKKLAKFYLDSKPFKSLKFLKKFINLPVVAESWMYDNIQGDISLKDFYGEFDLEHNQILLDTLEGNAIIDNAKIRFHKDLKTVDTKSVEIKFHNNNLSFKLNEPKYADILIDGSSVVINNLTSAKDGEVIIDIKANSKLDEEVLAILKAFKINIPLVQKNGQTNAHVYLNIPYSLSKKMITKGEFLVSNADILINKFAFSSKKAEILLDGTDVIIKNADFKHKNMIDANVNLKLDTKTLLASGDANIKSFLIEKSNGEKILHIQNKKTPMNFDFNKKVDINLDALSTNINITDLVYVNIKDLSKITPYSKLLKDISIKEGNINLQIIDDKNINFDAFVKGLEFPILKDGKKLTNLDIKGKIKDEIVTVLSKDENLKITIKDKQNPSIELKNLDILIDTKKEGSGVFPNLDIKLSNSKLNIGESIYNIVNANVLTDSNKVYFDGSVKDLDIPLKKDSKVVKKLDLVGSYIDGETSLKSKNDDLNLELKKDTLDIKLNSYDILYSTLDEKESGFKNINVNAKNSNIIVNEKYKFISDNFELRIRDNSKYLQLNHKKTDITFKESADKKIDLFLNDVSDEFINAIFNKQILVGGKLMLLASGDINNLDGKLILENTKIEDLAILNNLLLFIQSSPALINPLLAIPSLVGMATNGGFNLTGYKIINGNIEFNYSKEKELLQIKKLVTVGNGIDFDGTGEINLKDLTIDSKIKLIFLKDYSRIVGVIPVVNYVLLGDNNRVETLVNIFGDLNNPKISTNLTKDAFSVPLNIAKRILTSPAKLLEFIQGNSKEDESSLKPKPQEEK